MANLFTTEWAHDHVETQLQLPISIPVVWHLRDVCFSFREKEFDFLWRFPWILLGPVQKLFSVSSYRRMEQICVSLSMAMKHGLIT